MYENYAKKFHKASNVELLVYLARALMRANRLAECRQTLLRARHVAPEDAMLVFNLAVVQQKLSKRVLQDDKSQLRAVQNACAGS